MPLRDRIQALKDEFRGQYALRLHMTLLVGATAGAAAVISKLLLLAGMEQMKLRYPLAGLLAYGVFLTLIRVWLWYVAGLRTRRTDRGDLDLPDWPDVDLGHNWTSGWEWPDFGLPDLDDLFVPVLLLLAAVGLCGAGVYVIWTAPELLAEIAVEGLLAAGLHEGVLRMRDGRWLRRTLEGTWLALAGVLLFAFLAGWSLQVYCPSAKLLSQATACPVRHWQGD